MQQAPRPIDPTDALAPFRRRDAILSALSWAAATLLGEVDWRNVVPELLQRLGEAIDASRTDLLEIMAEPGGGHSSMLIGNWRAPHAPAAPAAHGRTALSRRFRTALSRGEAFGALVADFGPAERAFYASRSTQAVLFVPIFCHGEWWGALGIEECRSARHWHPGEIDALQAAAPILGRAIERSRQDAALREAAVRYRDLAGLGSDWYWEQDANLRFTYLSPDVEAVSGFPAASFLGKTRHETQPLGVDDATWATHLDDLQGRRPFRNFTFYRIDPQGRRRTYLTSGTPIFNAEGEFVGYRGIGRDVTAQLAAEDALRAKEAELEASRGRAEAVHRRLVDAIESLSDGFSLWDADDRLVLWNKRFVEIYWPVKDDIAPGLSFEAMVRANMRTGLTTTDGSDFDRFVAALVARHRAAHAFRELKLTNGVVLAIREFRTAEGGIVRLDSDISESQRKEAALIEARQQAESANRAKSAFIANMSHELRTPLNAILGFADIMQNELFGELLPRYREYAEDIGRSGAHLLALINDLLDTAKIEAGKYELKRRPVALAQIVGDALRLLAPRAAAAGVALGRHLPADLPLLSLDPRAIEQVLLNLLANAVKFTGRGGSATIEAALEGDVLSLAVVDTGVGIPAAELPRLARPFEQVENVWSRSKEGSGLGLAISKSLVELHGGSLSIASEVGRGTTVTIKIPGALESAPISDRDRPASASG